MIEIEDGSLFVADSHYPHHGDLFLSLLQKLINKELVAPQLFLMGDNFDLLFGYNQYIKTFSIEAIDLLQELSKSMPIYYFEGNHDFCLEKLFPEITVFSREAQPAYFTLKGKSVAISHGDKYTVSPMYNIYSKLLRNRLILYILRPLEKLIISHRMKKLSEKYICHHYEGLEDRVAKILEYYGDVDMVIEGHFHQGKIIGRYVSLPSQACQGMVAVVEDGKMLFVKI